MADIFVSEDGRTRRWLARVSQKCRALSFDKFSSWIRDASEYNPLARLIRGSVDRPHLLRLVSLAPAIAVLFIVCLSFFADAQDETRPAPAGAGW